MNLLQCLTPWSKNSASRRLRSPRPVVEALPDRITPSTTSYGNSHLDSNFGDYGLGKYPEYDDYHFTCSDMAVQKDGKILLAGTRTTDDATDIAVIRLKANGDLDYNFGDEGVVTIDFDGNLDEGRSIGIQKDGKIVIGGTTTDGDGYQDLAIARLKTNGALDYAFGDEGLARIDNYYDEETLADLVVQSNGKIVLAGTVGFSYEDSHYSFGMVTQLTSKGALDKKFGDYGFQYLYGFDTVSRMALQADGKIVVVGTGFDYVSVARLKCNGQDDTSFGYDGWATFSFDYNASSSEGVDVAIQKDGKIVVVGTAYYDSSEDTGDDSYDDEFEFGIGWGDEDTDDEAIDEVPAYDHSDIGVLRLNKNGKLDTKFGDYGTMTIDIGVFDVAAAVAIQSDGKIVVAGTTDAPAYYDDAGSDEEDESEESIPESSDTNFAVARITSKGRLDDNFEPQVIDFGGLDIASALAINSKGQILTAGSVWDYDFATAMGVAAVKRK